MDDIYNDDDSLNYCEFDEPTCSNDFFNPFNHNPDIKDFMIIGPLEEEEAWKQWERKNIEDDIPF